MLTMSSACLSITSSSDEEMCQDMTEDDSTTTSQSETDEDLQNSTGDGAHLNRRKKTHTNTFGIHEGYVSKRRVEAMSIQSITSDLKTPCGCERHCNEDLDPETVVRWRNKLHSVPMNLQRRQLLLGMYRESRFEDGRAKSTHFVEGKLICRKAWWNVLLKISESSYKRIKAVYNAGVHNLVKGVPKRSKASRGEIAVGYMKWYLSLVGDHNPESATILLPVGITRKEIYEQYKKSHVQDDLVSPQRFYQLWNENMSHVSQHRFARVTKCNVCTSARYLLEQTLPSESREAVIKEREEHLQRQQNERRSYYQRRAEAIANPQKNLSMIVDGMDQCKTNLSHFKGWKKPAACDDTKLLPTHIVGALVHGKTAYCMIDLNQWAHDSNLTLNCILQALLLEAKDAILPEILYIQLDNCSRENKNRFFIAFMALLVKRGFVKEVMMSFLMVGHTHEDVDAHFSRISTSLKRSDAMTLTELENIIQQCMSKNMVTIITKKVFNIREWLEPCLQGIHNHSYPHVYWIHEDNPGHVSIQYKNWSTEDDWKPSKDEDNLEIFKLDEDGNQILPDGIPEPVVPDFDKKVRLQDVLENIEKLRKNYLLSLRRYNWWKDFLSNPSQYLDETAEWPLNVLQPCQTVQQHVPRSDMVSPLSLLMENERRIPQVYTGNRKKPQKQNKEGIHNGSPRKIDPKLGFMIMFREDGDIGMGKVTVINPDNVEVNVYGGTMLGSWSPITLGDGEYFTKIVQRENWWDNLMFVLTKSMKLPFHVQQKLKTALK